MMDFSKFPMEAILRRLKIKKYDVQDLMLKTRNCTDREVYDILEELIELDDDTDVIDFNIKSLSTVIDHRGTRAYVDSGCIELGKLNDRIEVRILNHANAPRILPIRMKRQEAEQLLKILKQHIGFLDEDKIEE